MYNKKSAAAAAKYTKDLFTESGPKSKMASRNGGGDDPKGRTLKNAMQSKSAEIEINRFVNKVDDNFARRKATATDSEGRAFEDWGTSSNLEKKGIRGIGEYDANGKYYAESRDVSARKAVTKAAEKAKKEKRRKDIYKNVDPRNQ
jgi:hypothetical protein